MIQVRRVGLAILSVAAIAVFLLMEPDPPEEGAINLSAANYQQLIDVAMSDYDANDALADSAPQQQVVNGWVARDLLQIQALQFADLLDAVTQENSRGQVVASNDPRIPALLVLAIFAVSLVGLTLEDNRRPPVSDTVYEADAPLDGGAGPV